MRLANPMSTPGKYTMSRWADVAIANFAAATGLFDKDQYDAMQYLLAISSNTPSAVIFGVFPQTGLLRCDHTGCGTLRRRCSVRISAPSTGNFAYNSSAASQ